MRPKISNMPKNKEISRSISIHNFSKILHLIRLINLYLYCTQIYPSKSKQNKLLSEYNGWLGILQILKTNLNCSSQGNYQYNNNDDRNK